MTTTQPLPEPTSLADHLRSQVSELGSLWGIEYLAERVRISFSRRLTSSLGNCRPSTGVLTIADRLRDGPPELLSEVVAHEAAHAAAYLLHGQRVRPHGQAWAGLMREAGYPPRRALPVPPELQGPPRRRRYAWEHRCPVCAATRIGGRPVYEWRCVGCRRAGRHGVPVITRLELGR